MHFNNHTEAESAYQALKAFYRAEIQKAVKRHGSVNALARELGMGQSTVQNIINRDKFNPLRRLALEIEAIG